EYDLKGKYKEFRCVVGVDMRTGAESKARVTIEADGKRLFSEEVPAGAAPKDLNLPLIGAQRLRIVVASTNLLDLHDHVTLAEAQIRQYPHGEQEPTPPLPGPVKDRPCSRRNTSAPGSPALAPWPRPPCCSPPPGRPPSRIRSPSCARPRPSASPS